MLFTKHGKKRMKNRIANSSRIIKKAIEEGFSIETFSGDVRMFLESKRSKEENKEKIFLVHNQNIYIFSEALTLITTLNFPGRLLDIYNKQIKKIMNFQEKAYV